MSKINKRDGKLPPFATFPRSARRALRTAAPLALCDLICINAYALYRGQQGIHEEREFDMEITTRDLLTVLHGMGFGAIASVIAELQGLSRISFMMNRAS